MRLLPTLLLPPIPLPTLLPLPPTRRSMPLLPLATRRPMPPPMRALPLPTLLPMRALPPLTLRTPLPTPRRKPLRRRSKRLLYGLNGRADGVVNPRLPPAVLFPGS